MRRGCAQRVRWPGALAHELNQPLTAFTNLV